MAILRMCPNGLHFREFQNDPITGHRYHATCGETALATAMCCATPQAESAQDAINLMMQMTREMMAKGWATAPDGASRTATLKLEVMARGFTIADPYIEWQDPVPDATLHPLLLKWAGIKPFVLMITHAGEGLHAVDGSHAEAGVMGHFICVVGLADEGYVCNDGDNNVIADHLVIYPFSAIEKAHVTGILMLELQEAPTMSLPYTKLSNGNLQYKAGTLGGGFSGLVLSQNRTADLVIGETYYNSNECFCLFADGAVYHYDARTGKSEDGKAALVVQGLASARAGDQATIASLRAHPVIDPAGQVALDTLAKVKQLVA